MSRTSGPSELAISIDRGRPERLRDQLADGLRAAIAGGRLAPGTALPATRVLAERLGVSRSVVVEAYGELRQQGYLAIRARGEPRVAGVRQPTVPTPPAAPAGPRLDLAADGADPGLFPRRVWLEALRHALQSAPDRALGPADDGGQPALRRALAEYLGRARGAVAAPERVVVCQGGVQAVELACRLLALRGVRAVAVEDPCRPVVRLAAARAGLRVVPVAVDEGGLAVGRLPDVGAAIVAPAHQFPTGVVLAAERREALLASGLLLVEDDRGAEHAAAGPAAGVLQGAAPDRVLALGSVSGTLAPGLRLGWLVVPASLAAEAVDVRLALDGGSPALEQLALARLLESAAYERHLRRARTTYARRRMALVEALAETLPGVRVTGLEAGLHAVLELPEPVAAAELALRAAAADVRVLPVEAYLADPPPLARRLVVGYARLAPVAAGPTAHVLARLVGAGAPADATPRARRRRPPAPARAGRGGAPGGRGVRLRVMTFDVRDAPPGAQRAIVRAVRAAGADLVGLQNVRGATADLARALGWEHWDDAHHVISRLPLVRPPERPYVLVEAAPRRYLAHANVHLSPDAYGPRSLLAGRDPEHVLADERGVRLPEIAPVLSALGERLEQGLPVLLTGGFNAPCGAGWPVAEAIAAAGLRDVYLGAGRTWPVPGFPADPSDGADRVDAVLAGGPVDVRGAALVGERGGPHVDVGLADWPSDHRAIAADLRLVPGTVGALLVPHRPVVAAGEPVVAVLAGDPPERGSRAQLVAAGADTGRRGGRRDVAEAAPDGTLALATAGLRPGPYELVLAGPDGIEADRAPVWIASGAPPSIGVSRRRFRAGQPVEVWWRDAPGHAWDWIGLFPAGSDLAGQEPVAYRYCGARPSGSVRFDGPLAAGRYVAALLLDDAPDVLALTDLELVDR